MGETVRLAVTGLLTALVGGGLVAWINARARRPLVQAEAVQRLNDSTLKWAESLKEDADAAREHRERIREEADRDLAGLRRQVDELTGKLRDAIHTVDVLTDKLAMVQTEAWRPEPDVAAIRRLVGRPHSGDNNWH